MADFLNDISDFHLSGARQPCALPKYAPVAHSCNSQGQWHDLAVHLRSTANRAKIFGEDIGAAVPAFYLGLWHDLGKFAETWQNYLRAKVAYPDDKFPHQDHKAAGAILAEKYGWWAGLIIQAHHGGLKSPDEFRDWCRSHRDVPGVANAVAAAHCAFLDLVPRDLSFDLPGYIENDPLAADLFIRLLFSALVDADFLDTEAHFKPERESVRNVTLGLETLWDRFEVKQKYLTGLNQTPLFRARDEIYRACLAAAKQTPGFFRLSVPTGSGKTRSVMGFALRHALYHGHRRIIVAVPFISITEQTASVYRDIFGSGAVLEHHTSASCSEGFAGDPLWFKLAAENWDAPIVVTTTVQLFESLFSNSPAAVRKLHRLAGSVIILDEAQALPGHSLTPILDVLRDLCAHYGATVVISTATQPAFDSIPDFANLGARDMVSDSGRYFRLLGRVTYDWRLNSPLDWSECANIMRGADQCLAILNTKADALALFDELADPEALHLSTSLCGAHRNTVIKTVEHRIKQGLPCRLVSTQVVEAGVDLDFPLVLRALAPLDAIIQAAGRCNREGKLSEKGTVVVFVPKTGGLPRGYYTIATRKTEALLNAGPFDIDDPELSKTYFKRLFSGLDTDHLCIQRFRQRLDFPGVASAFSMIDDNTESVVVAYGSPLERHRVTAAMELLRSGADRSRDIIRGIQPYLVSIPSRAAGRYKTQGWLREVLPGFSEWKGGYDSIRGLLTDDSANVSSLES